MNIARTFHLYRKDLRETLRDRKTLLFLFLFPIILMPLSILGISRLAMSVVQKTVAQEVTIVASEENRDLYLELTHRHFTDSQLGQFLKLAKNPLASYLLPEEHRELLENVPSEIFDDPEAYYQWSHQFSDELVKAISDPFELISQVDNNVPEELTKVAPQENLMANQPSLMGRDLIDVLLTTVQGVGLVRFVDPAELGITETPEGTKLPEPLRKALNQGIIHGYLVIDGDIDGAENPRGEGIVLGLYHQSSNTQSLEAYRRIRQVQSALNEMFQKERLAEVGYDKNLLNAVKDLGGTDTSSRSEQAFSLIGGLLPYLIIAFAYLGAFYPAIDIGAGEKERRTLETLLLTPASRTEIAIGKFFVLFTTSVTAALLGIMAMAGSYWLLVPEIIIDKLNLSIPASTVGAIALLCIPPSAIIAGLFLSISIYAKSFKEGQNFMAPLGVAIILPAGVAMLPGLELTMAKAFIPIVNVSLLSRDFLKGDAPWLEYGVALASSMVVAGICIAIAVVQFRRESVIFRS